MDTNDDFYGKELNLNCFYMHTNFEQKYPKTAIVITQHKVLEQIDKRLLQHESFYVPHKSNISKN